MTAAIVRFPLAYHSSDEPPPDTGTYGIELEMRRVCDAAEDAQIAAEDFEDRGMLPEAKTALDQRDKLNERYAALKRQCDYVDGGW